MKDLWERLEAHATRHGRSLRLRPGATEKAVSDAERIIGRPFPADFRASLLVHDGQEPGEGDAAPFEFLPGCSPLAPVAAIAANWKDEQDYAQAASGDHTPEILNTLKHPLRIAVAGTPWWDGDNTYLDLTPAAAGTVGQVIAFTSECDMSVLGPSFRGALETYLDALDRGAWNYAADRGRVIGPEGFEEGNVSWNYGEWLAAAGKHRDDNSGKHAPFDGALPTPAAAPNGNDAEEHEITPASSRKAAPKKPAAKKPAPKKPTAKKPAAKKPAAKKPAAKKLASKKRR